MSLSSLHITSVCNRYTINYLHPKYQIAKYIYSGKYWCPVSKTRARIRLSSADNSTYGTLDEHSRAADDQSRTADERGLTGKEGKGHKQSLTSTECLQLIRHTLCGFSLNPLGNAEINYLDTDLLQILKKLQRYGLSGILSYGLLNTVYYTTAFLLVWFYISPAPGKLGFRAAAERFLKMMAVVWAGSQVAKLFRAGGALALAPFVDRGLSWFTVRFKFESQGRAFLTIVGLCLGLAVILFLAVTLLSA